MNVEALNRLFEAPAPESSIRKARNVDASEPEPDEAASAIHPPDEIPAGTLINDEYRIERKLGEGAMGVVFAATHLGLDEAVAIKFMRREVQDIDGTLARFDKEAKIETVPDLCQASASSAPSALEQRAFELRPPRPSRRSAPKACSHSRAASPEPVAREAGLKPTRVRLVAAPRIRWVEVPAARSHREGLR
jgi:hypothetical protein